MAVLSVDDWLKQQNSTQTAPAPVGIQPVSSWLKNQPPPPPKGPGFMSKATDFVHNAIVDAGKTLLVKPADRLAEAVGSTGLLGNKIATGYAEMQKNNETRTYANIPVEQQKAFGQGGAKQVAGDAFKSASYLAPVGRAEGAVSDLVKGNLAKGMVSGAIAGGIYGAAGGAGDALQQNENSAAIGHQAAVGGLEGAAGGALLSLGGAALARTADRLFVSKTPEAAAQILKADTKLPPETIAEIAPKVAQSQDVGEIKQMLADAGKAKESTSAKASAPEHPLAAEARKYESADDFTAKLEPVYRGVEKGIKDFSPSTRGALSDIGEFSVSPSKKVANRYRAGGGVIEGYISPTARIKDISGFHDSDFVKARKDGYDGVRFTNKDDEAEIQIFKKDAVLTKTQAEDIYTQATKTGEKAVESKTSGVAKDINTKAIEQGLTAEYKDMATYEPRTIKEQAAKIAELIGHDSEDLGRILRGEKPVPEGMSASYLVTAADKYATKMKDAKLLQDLISSKLTGEGSQHASELRMLGERDQSSAMKALKEINDAKAEASKTRNHKTKTTGEINKIRKAQFKVEEKAKNPAKNVSAFIDSITC